MSEFKKYELSFFDSEHLSEVIKNSHGIHKQVSKGVFRATLKSMECTDFVIQRGQYNQKLLVEGTSMQDYITLMIVHQCNDMGKFRGEDSQGGDFIVVLPGEEFEITLPPNIYWSTICVSKAYFDSYGLQINQSTIFKIAPKTFQQFNLFYHHLLSLFELNIYPHSLLQDMLISEYTKILECSENNIELTYRDASLLALNLRDEILQQIDQELRMKELCKISRRSVRTIERTFKNHFGVSPREYHSYHRFFLARQHLINTNTNVSEAAIKHGYLHLGRFSQKYKEIFGELPSETIKNRL